MLAALRDHVDEIHLDEVRDARAVRTGRKDPR